jgi:hypothetical protein
MEATILTNRDPNKYKVIYKSLPLDFHPQQNEFKFGDITITSKYDNGNLLQAENPFPETVRSNLTI